MLSTVAWGEGVIWRKPRQLVIVCGVFIALILVLVLVWRQQSYPKLRVTVLDVGQGDAMLVSFPSGQRWLIDGGPDNRVVSTLDQMLPWYDRRLTGIMLTHPHADHVTGLIAVLRRYRVSYVLMPDVTHTTPEYLTFLRVLQEQRVSTTAVTHPFRWQGQDHGVPWQWEFFYPERSYPEVVSDLNAVSIVSRLSFGERRFLFTGDAPENIEYVLLAEGRDLKADVLKVGHHGSNGSTGAEFLKAVQPSRAAISVGAGNRFGHPAPATLRRLAAAKVAVYRTDTQGSILFITDGHTLSVEPGR